MAPKSSEPTPAGPAPAAPAEPGREIAPLAWDWRSQWNLWLGRARQVPRKYYALALTAAAILLLLAFSISMSAGSANLHLRVEHGFRSAGISVWVDNDLAYNGRLSGAVKKRFGLIPGGVGGSFSQVLRVPAGKHLVRVQISAPGDGYVETRSLAGEFADKSEKALVVSSRRSGLDMAWDDGVAAPPIDTGSAWYLKYANSLLMTAAGSIVSALTAYLIKELPVFHRSPNGPAPKG